MTSRGFDFKLDSANVAQQAWRFVLAGLLYFPATMHKRMIFQQSFIDSKQLVCILPISLATAVCMLLFGWLMT